MRVLFATPEIYPLNKVGGLGDFGDGLLPCLASDEIDVRVILPGYASVKRNLKQVIPLAPLMDIDGSMGCLLGGKLPDNGLKVMVVDLPGYFERFDSPYGDNSKDTSRVQLSDRDIAKSFSEYSRYVIKVAMGQLIDWHADIVHCNDWVTGLIPALLARVDCRPATVFTIHNLAHQGIFPRSCFDYLKLSDDLWSINGLEYYGQMSFMKGGLVFADMLNTVSPSYAREIRTAEFGNGLDGLLKDRSNHLTGILNGVDYRRWDPATDVTIAQRYSTSAMAGKARCKTQLQQALGLSTNAAGPLLGMVSRLTHQKGIELVIEGLAALMADGRQLAILGQGDNAFESELLKAVDRFPGRLSMNVGYSEDRAHQIIAGADMFLMPSQFEPCGLTQLYSLKYGTIPIVHQTGGLIDSVVDATETHIDDGVATGFGFRNYCLNDFLKAVKRAHIIFNSERWVDLQRTAMQQDYSWGSTAAEYRALYRRVCADRKVHHKTDAGQLKNRLYPRTQASSNPS